MSNEPRFTSTKLSEHPQIAKALQLVRAGKYVSAELELDTLLRFSETNTHEQDLLGLTARSIAAEIYDHNGRYEEARRTLNQSDSVLESLTETKLTNEPSIPRLVRARCWYALQCGVSCYRFNDYYKASTCFERSIRILESNEFSARFYGPLSQLYYWWGHVKRHRQEYPRAIEYYQKAMKYVDQSFVSHTHNPSSDRIQFALYQLGSCLAMGLGWTHFRSGNLASAESALLAARPLLRIGGDDVLRRAYSNLLLGSVYRAQAGTLDNRRALLAQAIELLRDALRQFHQRKHTLYRGRARFELALAHANLPSNHETLSSALEYAIQALTDATESSDWECWCQVQIAISRIYRRLAALETTTSSTFDIAMQHARMAKRRAEETHQELSRIEALIAQGELSFWEGLVGDSSKAQDLYVRATNFLREALESGERYPRYAAICNLHLARTYTKLLDSEKARICFEEYSAVESHIQNGFILDFAGQVKRELYPKDVLLLDPQQIGPDGKMYVMFEGELRRFLVNRVNRAKNREQAIIDLGISRQTFFNWQKEMQNEPNETRANRRRLRLT